MEKILRDIVKVLNFNDSFFEEVESFGKLGFCETDLSSGKFKASTNFKKLFNLPERDLYRIEEYQEIIHPDDMAQVLINFNTCLKERRNFESDYRVIVKGDVRYFRGKFIFILDDSGEPVKVVGMKQDITEEKLADIEKRACIKKLEHIHELATTIVHDLKAPIHNISIITELLKGNVAEGKANLIEVLEKSCQHSYEIIEDVLENNLAEESGGEIAKEYYHIPKLVHKAVSTLYYTAQKKNIKILTNLQPDIYAFVHLKKLQRAIENLLLNGVKFSHMDSQIEVSLYEEGDTFVVKIEDFGRGMDELQISSLFQKDNPIKKEGTSGEKSYGLGLNIVKKITNQHGGEIWVESHENEGSTFYIELPKG